MTVRLIGLMSLVLALCLATFAFMTRWYHDEVMQELPRTVAEAGQAAIRSLEPSGFTFEDGTGLARVRMPAPPVDLRDLRERTEELRRITADAVAHETLSQGRRLVLERELESAGALASAFGDCEGETGADCFEWRSTADGGTATQIIRIDAIHAHSDPDTGVLLRIPTVRTVVVRHDAEGTDTEETVTIGEVADAGPDGAPAAFTFEMKGGYHVVLDGDEDIEHAGPQGTEPATILAGPTGVGPSFVGRDIVFPIPTDDYQAAYDRFRNKSLLLLAGVFGVGLVLTTGLAARFTRPVRKLDGAVREIADGNLDVAVPVHGRDELARLGTAFNEMTRKLREGRERARELTRREKLSALGRLAAGVAHDVRNPLHSISLTLEHLRETHRPGDESGAHDFDRSIEIIKEEIRRLDGLVSSFLRFAASGGRERTRVRPGALIEEVERLVRKEAEWRGIRVHTDTDGGDPEVDADVESLRASILNLVLNAFEAMPEGGDLTLRARAEDDGAVVEVRDTGVGIPEDDRERVFDFGWSTRENGSGLGLAIVHRCIVEDHGGRVRLDSRVGHGTTVALHLPAAGADEATS